MHKHTKVIIFLFIELEKKIVQGEINNEELFDTGYYLGRYLLAKAIRYIAIGDNVDTSKQDGLQFLTFKLSFNDYYAQDICNKIKSIKQKKLKKENTRQEFHLMDIEKILKQKII